MMEHSDTGASDGIPSVDVINSAAVRWCGRKNRETFPEDIEYFKRNWRALPGLRAVVDEVLAENKPCTTGGCGWCGYECPEHPVAESDAP